MLELNWQNNLMKQNFSLALNPSSPCHPRSPSHCFFLSFKALHKAVNGLLHLSLTFVAYIVALLGTIQYPIECGYWMEEKFISRKVHFRAFWGEKTPSGYRMIPHAV